MSSGEYFSSGRVRVAAQLDDEHINQIARRAMDVAGIGEGLRDPRALAVALGYRTVWAPTLPNETTSMVIGKTIYYADCQEEEELAQRVALPLAHLILEAWGYDLSAAELLSQKLAG